MDRPPNSILTMKGFDRETHHCECGRVGEEPEDCQSPEDCSVMAVQCGYSEKEDPIGDAEAEDCCIACEGE